MVFSLVGFMSWIDFRMSHHPNSWQGQSRLSESLDTRSRASTIPASASAKE